MTRKRKVLVILQLCFAFGYFFWLAFQPILRPLTAKKAAEILLESLVEDEIRFSTLDEGAQLKIMKGYENVKKGNFRPLTSMFRLNPFGVAWAILSLVVCFLLLFHIEGAPIACWVLPLSVLAYGLCLGRAPPPLQGESVFPKEAYVTDMYISPTEEFKNKQLRLQEGWHRYLVAEWAHKEMSNDPTVRAEQIAEGVFRFNVQRANFLLDKRGEDAIVAYLFFHPTLIQLCLYLGWNLFFAIAINRRLKSTALSAKI
ncbi:MAG: hypothetical protein ACKVOH_01160 [Chlamydiales bacterium]